VTLTFVSQIVPTQDLRIRVFNVVEFDEGVQAVIARREIHELKVAVGRYRADLRLVAEENSGTGESELWALDLPPQLCLDLRSVMAHPNLDGWR